MGGLFGVENLDTYLVLGILAFFGLIEVIAGYLSKTQRTAGDWLQEAGGFVVLSVFIKPAIVFSVLIIGNALFPSLHDVWAEASLFFMLPFYLLIDDVLQYWYHRSAHEYEFLWKLHRPHHQAEEMGFFISYRNAALYYVIMPNIWWVGICIFLGGASGVALGLILKQLVIIGSHSTIKWDLPFYKYKIFHPIIFILERIIITPAFHHAHHGKSMLDGASDPNGNYGNMFSIWDQLFGTATFTRKFPKEYGLQTDPKEEWTAAYFYPAITAKNPESEISRGFKKDKTARLEAAEVHLEKGEKYLWCVCGKSKNQPFCDGMHHGSKFKPMVFEAKRSGKVKLCNCKATKSGPFCDDTHIQLLKEI
jgi:sterol desaturase/sphingolipid hydroxylase (fatty acid hydroxylase superfamily)/CDGSH-type Zn-finger protein